jgi:hypothetical protein
MVLWIILLERLVEGCWKALALSFHSLCRQMGTLWLPAFSIVIWSRRWELLPQLWEGAQVDIGMAMAPLPCYFLLMA